MRKGASIIMAKIIALVLALLLAGYECADSSQLVSSHWPDVPLTSTECEKVQGLYLYPDAVSEYYYNSVHGVLIIFYRFADGTEIETFWIVTDLAHEEAGDYSIRLQGTMTKYTWKFKDLKETWVDVGGRGECQDFRLRGRE
jgi:hypothetical protein